MSSWLFIPGYDEEAGSAIDSYGSDSFIGFPTWQWIEAQVKTGDAPVYRYRFDLAATPSKISTLALCLSLRRYRIRVRNSRHPAGIR